MPGQLWPVLAIAAVLIGGMAAAQLGASEAERSACEPPYFPGIAAALAEPTVRVSLGTVRSTVKEIAIAGQSVLRGMVHISMDRALQGDPTLIELEIDRPQPFMPREGGSPWDAIPVPPDGQHCLVVVNAASNPIQGRIDEWPLHGRRWGLLLLPDDGSSEAETIIRFQALVQGEPKGALGDILRTPATPFLKDLIADRLITDLANRGPAESVAACCAWALTLDRPVQLRLCQLRALVAGQQAVAASSDAAGVLASVLACWKNQDEHGLVRKLALDALAALHAARVPDQVRTQIQGALASEVWDESRNNLPYRMLADGTPIIGMNDRAAVEAARRLALAAWNQ